MNVIKLLEGWIDLLRDASSGINIFLPFDYSDQYIGGLNVLGIDDENVSISYAITIEFTGSGTSPSQFRKLRLRENQLQITSSSFAVPKTDVIKEIRQSIEGMFPMASMDENCIGHFCKDVLVCR